MSIPNNTIKCSQALFAVSKSYNQIKRKRRNDSKEKSEIAKLTKIELLGLCRRGRVPQITRQTEMLPSKFAMNVGLRTAVSNAIEMVLGWDGVKLESKLLEALLEPSMSFKHWFPASNSHQTVAVLRTVSLSAAIDKRIVSSIYGFDLYTFFSATQVHFLLLSLPYLKSSLKGNPL